MNQTNNQRFTCCLFGCHSYKAGANRKCLHLRRLPAVTKIVLVSNHFEFWFYHKIEFQSNQQNFRKAFI